MNKRFGAIAIAVTMKLRYVGAVAALIAAAAGTATVALGAQVTTSLRGTIALTGSPCIYYPCASQQQIYLFDLATGKLSQLTKGPGAHWALAWSPDGSRLLVAELGGPDPHGLYSLRADDSSATLLTRRVDGFEARWSPNGRRVAFLAPGTARSHLRSLYVVNANGTHRRLLTTRVVRYGPQAFSWAPDGKRIVFVRPGPRPSLYTVTTTGRPVLRPVRRIQARTHCAQLCDASEPTWSPDGSRIAFMLASPRAAAAGLARSRVAVMRAKGSRRALKRLRIGDAPFWSPNSSWIAATEALPPHQSANWVMHPNGTGARTFQGSSGITFSPDSANLAYVGGKRPVPNGDLWIASTKGSNSTRVLHDGGLYFYRPLWRGGTASGSG
jgi:Tol biopolymer transport system component